MKYKRSYKEYQKIISLPAKVSQQTLRLLHNNWQSFFNSIKDWKIHPEKYKGRPKLPQYKDKIDGRVPSYIRCSSSIEKRIKTGQNIAIK